MSIERHLCQALIKDEKGLRTLTQFGIRPSLFRTERPLFDFIIRHHSAHSVMPTEAVIRRVIADFVDEVPEQPLSYYCQEIVERERCFLAAKATKEGGKLLEEFKVDDWASVMTSALYEIETQLGESTDVIIDGKERAGLVEQRYLERLETGGVSGIPLPWEWLTKEAGGMQAGDVNVISAQTGVGKTWMLLNIGLNAWLGGKKVLLISKEISGEMIEDRFHALYGSIPYKMFRQGKLEECLYQQLISGAKTLCDTDSRRFIVVDDVKNAKGGLMDIRAKIEEYKPDLVLVDGIYLVSDDKNDDLDWKAVARVIIGLKRVLRKYEIPGVVTTQNRDLTNVQKKGGNASNSTNALAYTKELSRIATLVMILEQSPEDRASKQMTIWLPKVREGENLQMKVNWDFESMNFQMLNGSSQRESVFASTVETMVGDTASPEAFNM